MFKITQYRFYISQGVLDRGASIRVGRDTEKNGKGSLLNYMYNNMQTNEKNSETEGDFNCQLEISYKVL